VKRTGLALLAMVVAASASSGADWPQFLGPDRNGVSPEKGLARSWPADGPEVLWTVELSRGFGGACIQGGKVYVLDRDKRGAETLRCLDLATGKEDWTFSYDAPGQMMEPGSRSVPAADENNVYTIGAMGHIHCVSKATHKPVWKGHLMDDFGGGKLQTGVCQCPLLHEDTLIVAPLTAKAGVVALDKATGKIVWQSPAVGTQKYASPTIIKAGGVEQVVVLGSNSLEAVQVGTGKPLWKFTGWRSNQPVPNPIAIDKDRLFFTCGYGMGFHQLQLSKQGDKFGVESLASGRRPASMLQAPVFHRGAVFMNASPGGLTCAAPDGKVKWQTPRVRGQQELGGFIIADGLIYKMNSTNGVLTMIEASTAEYKELGKASILKGEKIWGPMALSDGKLVLRDLTQMKCVNVKAP